MRRAGSAALGHVLLQLAGIFIVNVCNLIYARMRIPCDGDGRAAGALHAPDGE